MPQTIKNDISTAIMVLNTVLSGGAFIYAQNVERRLATMEANMALVMQTFDLVPKQTTPPPR